MIAKRMNSISLLATLVAMAGLLSLSACNNGSRSSNDNGPDVSQYATVPTPSANSCFQPAASSQWWTYYNVQAYPMQGYGSNYQGAFAQGFCGCPFGAMPTCSQQGLLCIPTQHLNTNVAMWTWGPRGFNPQYQWYNPHLRHRPRRWPRHNEPIRHRAIHTIATGEDADTDTEENLRQMAPLVGQCMTTVAQLCSPAASPGEINGMICRPLNAANPGGPGVWVRIR